jgi:CubicO group peptidase (beta-lactamase class C family)
LPDVTLTDADPARQARITMRHLLSHTAGIDCELAVDLATVGNGEDALGEAIGFYDGLHQWAEPGQIMSYGNTGFWLAGHVIATLLGTTFEEAMRQRVYTPLGLERSVFTAEDAIVYPVALGHQPKTLPDGPHELIRSYAYPRARTPSGGVISTVVDLLRFAAWHISGGGTDSGVTASIGIADDLRLAMQEPVVRLRAADHESWGIGWTIRYTTNGTKIIGHGGSFGGFQTQLTIVPSRDFAFAILTNSARGSMPNHEIEERVFQSELGLSLGDPAAHDLTPSELASFAGSYRQPLAAYDVKAVDGGLEVIARTFDLTGDAMPVAPPMRFDPVGERDFIVRDGAFKGTRADFILDPETNAPAYVRIGLRVAERVA